MTGRQVFDVVVDRIAACDGVSITGGDGDSVAFEDDSGTTFVVTLGEVEYGDGR